MTRSAAGRGVLRRDRTSAGAVPLPIDVAQLLRWYRAERRDLPWRRTPTPYRVCVSEVMLQQTRVETVLPYYRRFLRLFPSWAALARADAERVLSAWEGLGYYRRARLLREAAAVVTARGGRLPRTAAGLRELPGIGAYTAAAVASIAFGAAEPVIDGNVERVLGRVLGLDVSPRRARALLAARLRATIPTDAPGEFNQALMELGATVCTHRRPRCGACPVSARCHARRSGDPEAWPRRERRRRSPLEHQTALAVLREDRVLLRQRSSNGLLGGLWGLPSFVTGKGAIGEHQALRHFRDLAGWSVRLDRRLPALRQVYSHLVVLVTPIVCSPAGREKTPAVSAPFRWASTADLERLPLARIDRRALDALGKRSP